MRTIMKMLTVLGGGGVFSPLTIPNTYWYDPYTTGIADGQPVGTLVERSGSGNDGSAAGAARPTMDTDAFGTGLAGLSFDGGDSIDINGLASIFAGVDQPYSLMLAIKQANTTSTKAYFGVSGSTAADITHHTISTTSYTCFRDDDVPARATVAGGTPDTNTHVLTILFTGTAMTLYEDGVAIIDNASMNNGQSTLTTVAIGCLPQTAKTLFWNGVIGDVLVASRVWTAPEIATLEAFVAPRCGLSYPFDFALTSPQTLQVFQRSGSTGAISIAGTILAAGSHDVEARFNGGDWATIASGESGAFTGTLSAQAQGQGTFEIRLADTPQNVTRIAEVGIGVGGGFLGQSNPSGRGTNNQSYSHASLKAVNFDNHYRYRNLEDPYDTAINQVDTVSSDTSPAAAGSFVPLLATLIMQNTGVPFMAVPCAKGGTSITAWLPGADHFDRSTLYGSAAYRLQQSGAEWALWWQGETDAQAGMSQATYNGHLDTIANAIFADLGIKLMVCKLQDCSGADVTTINAAIVEAYGDNANVLTGPDLSDIETDDTFHLQTNAKLQLAADRWWTALETAFYS